MKSLLAQVVTSKSALDCTGGGEGKVVGGRGNLWLDRAVPWIADDADNFAAKDDVDAFAADADCFDTTAKGFADVAFDAAADDDDKGAAFTAADCFAIPPDFFVCVFAEDGAPPASESIRHGWQTT